MSASPLGITQFGSFTLQTGNLIQQAIQQAGYGTTGNVFYCDPVNGLDTNLGTSPQPGATPGQGPVQTLAAGYALLTSGHNDVLVLIGNGASTGSARITTFTWAKDAAHLFGICSPTGISQRARIAFPLTAGLTVTPAFFTLSGNGCLFQNVSFFQGASAGQTGIAASICVTVSGGRNSFVNCDIEGMGDTTASASATSRSLKITGTTGENRFVHCNIGLDTVTRTNANASVELAGGTPRNSFEDCTFQALSGDGASLTVLATGANAIDRWQSFQDCTFMNCIKSGATAQAVLISMTSASPGGLIILQSCFSVGNTKLGDTNALANTYVLGPTPVSGAFLAINPA